VMPLIKESCGHDLARVIVVAPNQKRRDWIADVIRPKLAGAHLPPDRFWIVSRPDLESSGLFDAFWRVPERADLMPLVQPRLA
jgi:hypothetical protein